MSRIPSLNSPFLLGFDGIERMLERAGRNAGDGYPPYNIERIRPNGSERDTLRITLAVAGFRSEDLDVTLEDNQLTIRGKQAEETGRDYLHRGIAARQFQRSFVLADGMEVSGAALENGLLVVDLARPEPDRVARKIEIRQRN